MVYYFHYNLDLTQAVRNIKIVYQRNHTLADGVYKISRLDNFAWKINHNQVVIVKEDTKHRFKILLIKLVFLGQLTIQVNFKRPTKWEMYQKIGIRK